MKTVDGYDVSSLKAGDVVRLTFAGKDLQGELEPRGLLLQHRRQEGKSAWGEYAFEVYDPCAGMPLNGGEIENY